MEQGVRDEIRMVIRTGFYTRQDVYRIFCEEMYAPGELNPRAVRVAVDEEYARVLADQHTWPVETDCDRLDQAFTALNAQGIIALQNAGFTQSDSYEDVQAAYQQATNRERLRGYCFYHGQDLESAVTDGYLLLAFGPIHPDQEETEGPAIGQEIVTELEKHGFTVQWDGTFGQRITIKPITWQRRLPDSDAGQAAKPWWKFW